MGELAPAKLEILRRIVDAAPDRALHDLCQALSSDGPYDDGLTAVRTVLEAERKDRRVRNAVLGPVAPMCASGRIGRLKFPPGVLKALWRAVKAAAPDEAEQAAGMLSEWREVDPATDALCDRMCALAAERLAEPEGTPFQAVADACEADRPGSAADLIACLQITAVTRRSVDRLHDWLGRMTGEKAAELRLAYRDICAIREDAGPYYVEMLSAQIAEPWQVLRIVAGVMERPSEAYLSASELSHVPEALMASLDAQLAAIGRFGPDASPDEARQIAHTIDCSVHALAELEQCIALNPNGPWGRRVIGQKKGLALRVEAHLRATEDQVGRALPLQPVKLGPRSTRNVPRLNADPEPLIVAKAMTMLRFTHEVQMTAATGGFASLRNKVLETVCARIDNYVEDLLETIRAEPEEDEAVDLHRARAYLEILADFSTLARDEKAGQIVRRRAAAA